MSSTKKTPSSCKAARTAPTADRSQADGKGIEEEEEASGTTYVALSGVVFGDLPPNHAFMTGRPTKRMLLDMLNADAQGRRAPYVFDDRPRKRTSLFLLGEGSGAPTAAERRAAPSADAAPLLEWLRANGFRHLQDGYLLSAVAAAHKVTETSSAAQKRAAASNASYTTLVRCLNAGGICKPSSWTRSATTTR